MTASCRQFQAGAAAGALPEWPPAALPERRRGSRVVALSIETEKMRRGETELRAAIAEFTAWADAYPIETRHAAWEADYHDWPGITRAFADFLDATAPADLGDAMIECLIFILARDNEMEILKGEFIARPAHLLHVARAGLASVEPDARWQFADALADPALPSVEATMLLEQFIIDTDDYVRRRALLAMGQRQSPRAALHAEHAWATGDEYQRIAALDVLARCRSPRLAHYLALALEDGHEYLMQFAERLRSRQHDDGAR